MHIIWQLWRDRSDANAGGAEAYEHEVLERLAQRGHQVTVLVGGVAELESAHLDRGYKLVANGGEYSQYLLSPLTRMQQRRSVGRPDVIVDSSNGMTFFSPLTSRTPVVALVHHVHVDQWADYFSAPVAHLGRFLERGVMPRVYRKSCVIAVSDSTKSDLVKLGLSDDRITVITAGADHGLPRGDSLPDGPAPTPTFLALGRLVPNKRLELLLDIWEDVFVEVGGVLRIVGHGPLFHALSARDVPGVEVTGRVSEADKHRFMREAWFLVHAAKHEGWGLVINELAAQGRPTLAFAVPGVTDAVVAGETGLLAESPEEFARLWIGLARDEPRRRRLGQAARQRAESMTWDGAADRVESVLLKAVATHGR